MITLSLSKSNSKTQNFREKIIEYLKISVAIKPLQYFYHNQTQQQLSVIKTLPQGTLGFDLFTMLNLYNLKTIPKFETHDLKHIILGYGMTSVEEIRMQAYLFGNGNKTLVCLLFLASGLIFPEHWKKFYKDYQKGKQSPSIHDLSFQKAIYCQTKDLKNRYIK